MKIHKNFVHLLFVKVILGVCMAKIMAMTLTTNRANHDDNIELNDVNHRRSTANCLNDGRGRTYFDCSNSLFPSSTVGSNFGKDHKTDANLSSCKLKEKPD